MSILNQVDLTKIVDPNLVFETTPAPGGLYLCSLVVYGLLILGSVILGVISRRNPQSNNRKLWRQFIYLMLVVGMTGPVLVFLRWQSIPYLGSRLITLLLWLVAIAWLCQIIYYWIFVLPHEIELKKEKENFEKYLPRA